MKSAISEAPAAGIGKLLMDSRFVVPSHQRDYSWTEDHIKQLFEDIEAALEREDSVYFLGLMVFLASSEGHLVVLDGQQRLATAVIIFSAIRSWLQQYTEHQEDANKIQEWFIGRSELGEKSLQPRLTMNVANDQMFNEFVIRSAPLGDIKAAHAGLKRYDPNRELLEATIYAHERLRKTATDLGTPDKAAAYFVRFALYMRDNVSVVRLTVASEEAAFTIFETLNDRGLDLSPLDLVKNHLFSRSAGHSSIRLRDMEARWAQMMATLSNVRADNFLKAFWTSRHGRIRSTNLFEAFKRQYSDADSALDLSMDVLAASEQYAALDSADHPVWAPYSAEARNAIRSLKLLGSQQVHPVLLASINKMEIMEFERLLRMFEVITVRYLLIGGGHTGRLETSCAVLARMIYAGELSTATQAFQELREFYPSDDEFKHSFRVKQERNNQKAQYFLKILEKERRRSEYGGMADEFQSGALTIEHILPKNPSKDWDEVIADDPTIGEDCVFRLGNLCLLTKINKELGRSAFEEKKEVCGQSQLLVTSELSSYEEWNRDAIDRRQAKMAKLAAQAWRFQ